MIIFDEERPQYATNLILLQEKSKIREVFFCSACYTAQVTSMRTLVRWEVLPGFWQV